LHGYKNFLLGLIYGVDHELLKVVAITPLISERTAVSRQIVVVKNHMNPIRDRQLPWSRATYSSYLAATGATQDY
jgi:hypothetical protein